MRTRYSFTDYETAYYKCNINKCIEIGREILSHFSDKRSKELIKKLNKIKYQYDLPIKKLKDISNTLLEVKIYIMINRF